MDNKLAKIYRITNLVNNSTYIGQTTMSLEDRWLNHIKNSEENIRNGRVYHWVKTYGEENFKIEKIDETFYRHRFIVEQYYIEKELERNIVCINKDVKSDDFKELMSLVTSDSKNGMYNKVDEDAVNGQTVTMLNDEGEVVKTFVSVKMALKHLGLKGHVGLYNAVKNNTKYHGYYWNKTEKKYI